MPVAVEAALAAVVEAPAAVEVAGPPVAAVAAHNRPFRRSLPVRLVRAVSHAPVGAARMLLPECWFPGGQTP